MINEFKVLEHAQKHFAELVPEIAAALPGWSLVPIRAGSIDADNPNYRELIGPNSGESIGLYRNHDGRIHISGNFTYRIDLGGVSTSVWNTSYGEKVPSISVALSKTGTKIANDIERRLLPAYRVMLADNLKAIASYQASHTSAMDAAKALGATVGAPIDGRDPTAPRLNLYRSSALPERSGGVTVRESGVTFDHFEVSHTVAAKILALLVAERKA